MNMLSSIEFRIVLFGMVAVLAVHFVIRLRQHILVTETEMFLREVSGDRK